MDNAPTISTLTDGSISVTRYDKLGRVTSYNIHNSEAYTSVVHTNYSYTDRASDATKTSGLVSNIDYEFADIDGISYTYDALGNIKTVTYENGDKESYSYDKLSRLVRANSTITDETVIYVYDDSGNILRKVIYDYTTADTPTGSSQTIYYTYDTTWKDKLVSYNGTAITYDAIGNPLTYGDNSFTWNGRRMATFSDGTATTSYKYNEDGVRTSKTVGGTTTYFFVDGTTILAQRKGNTQNAFYYDANGKRIAFRHGGLIYYYVYNLQGDVTHILDFNGDIVGTYEYDAWGNITNLASLTAIAQINPFRYRGYYYDTESGLYYLNSRYYNPEWGRFLNADGYVTTGQGLTSYNMFAYCGNNPIAYADYDGQFTVSIFTEISASFGLGCSVGKGISFDDNGNIAIQWDYSAPINADTFSVSLFGISFMLQLQITNLDNVEQLNGPSLSFGSAQNIYKLISISEDIILSSDEAVGIKLGAGLSVGSDPIHINQAYTTTTKIYNIPKMKKVFTDLSDVLSKLDKFF